VLFDAGGERLGAAPLEVKEGRVRSVAFATDGRFAAGYERRGFVGGVVLFDAGGERLGAAPLEVKEGRVRSVAFATDGRLAAGYEPREGGGGVVLLDADPASWWRKVAQTVNRNFTWSEWTQYFPKTPYRRTIRSFPGPSDLPEEERKQAEALEKKQPERNDAP
jgi:hypothetical protein